METLRELHLRFRQEDKRDPAWRERLGQRRSCRKAIVHCANGDGKCIWCGVKFERATPKPKEPWNDNDGAILIQEAYDYHWNPDGPADRLPRSWESITEERWI